MMGRCTGGLFGHGQITDACLLTAAARHSAKLLAFNRGIPQLLVTPEERRRLLCVLI